jgi:hypothetical protein
LFPIYFGQATGAADHLLGQREALAGIRGVLRQAEQGRDGQAEEFAGFAGETEIRAGAYKKLK